MTSFFSLMATPQLQVTPSPQYQSRVWIFLKKKQKEDFSLLYKSTAVFNCLHFYLVYRNVDDISKIFWEVSSETWLEFLGSISFTKKGINIAKVLID